MFNHVTSLYYLTPDSRIARHLYAVHEVLKVIQCENTILCKYHTEVRHHRKSLPIRGTDHHILAKNQRQARRDQPHHRSSGRIFPHRPRQSNDGHG